MNSKSLTVDVVVFGAGITGLWLCNRLMREGYSCLLVERQAVGGTQTLASQGIIHGGAKYTLIGKLTASSEAIREMPAVWRACLDGTGVVDLSAVRVLSPVQYLWTTGNVLSRAGGFIASQVMQSRVERVPADQRPGVFDGMGARGQLYRLNEPVLDVASLVRALAAPVLGCTSLVDDVQLANGELMLQDTAVQYQRLIFAAGAGNDELLRMAGLNTPTMQLRPLHMVMVRGDLPPMFGHCIGAGGNPRLTITSYPLKEHGRLWYMGGDLAEKGVELEAGDLIDKARREVQDVLPWLDWNRYCQWATHRVERAEVGMQDGRRPDSFSVTESGELFCVWPTKLAFAPKVAETVLNRLREQGVRPSHEVLDLHEPSCRLAGLPWEEGVQWT